MCRCITVVPARVRRLHVCLLDYALGCH